MKKTNAKNLILWGLIPYIATLVYSIITIFFGFNSCLFNPTKKTCEIVYGFRSTGYVWYRLILSFYPAYLISLILIILGYTKKYNINDIRKKILCGISPFILSSIAFINTALAKTGNTLSTTISNVFLSKWFIIIPELLGIIYLIMIVLNPKIKKDI